MPGRPLQPTLASMQQAHRQLRSLEVFRAKVDEQIIEILAAKIKNFADKKRVTSSGLHSHRKTGGSACRLVGNEGVDQRFRASTACVSPAVVFTTGRRRGSVGML